ncbi:type II toxin-antitoxin system Phd/YefM family antitoxin [Kaistia sp. UC242_56]|uniref:type II toxin-antitoxin system Phd/YefM family antitoxin n=1 Tax=Kaistia sp. UC242_56 TaxID=3374625 RepID=UPI0037A776E7
MTTTTLTSREFNQDTSRARKAANEGPVIITDRGRPAHVLLSIEEYRRLTGKGMSLLEALTPAEPQDVDFDPPKLGNMGFKPVDFD